MSKLYLVTVTILSQKEGLDFPLIIYKMSGLLAGYSNATEVVHRFKVSGEAQILAIFEVTNIIGLERTIAGLWRLGGISVTCSPLIAYELFASFLNVEERLTIPSPQKLPDVNLYWLEFDGEYHGNVDNFLATWHQEATKFLSARVDEGLQVHLYKVVMERKVHCFISLASEKLEELAFNLPLLQKTGSPIRIKCKSVQLLDSYMKKIMSDQL